MKNFIYSTELTLDGPWLLDRDALLELSTIIEDSWDRLCQRQSELLDKYVTSDLEQERKDGLLEGLSEEDLESRENKIRERAVKFYKSQKDITFKLGKDKSYNTDSLSNSLTEQALIGEEVTDIEIKLESGNIQGRISVEKEYERLRIQTSPEREDASKELFVELREWAIKNRPPIWQRLWRHFYGTHWFIWFVILFFSIIIMPDTGKRVVEDAKKEAYVILEDGISSDEVGKAIELLLTIETKYSLQTREQKFPSWLKLFFWAGLIMSVLLSFRPKVIIAIGKGTEKIIFWKKWLRFISITLPGVLCGSFLWPYLSQVVIKFLQ